ncbi:unnamed protein product [Leptidea sinapis]|uniref:Carboxylesterase type B domain-containing protein n=1 Tax=Leptidea sinapis TaxID=189913 RepID=A0A5E4QFY4_9NEOP|nr:unnamed protein product [Leptidea sinapis]
MLVDVDVNEGTLRGKRCTTPFGKEYYSFEGVPYARPPVGKLRFRDPQEPERWMGVRDATKPGNKAAQSNPFVAEISVDGSEDCLYLNVYTPCLPAETLQKLPVIFFIHGGRLLLGCGDYHRPDYFISHNVIVVTINYRLNIFGFLCLHTPEIPGNAGLKDTVMALKWVKNNIRYFNGDPGNITAFGESAGGAIATSYLASRMTRGMVSKIISQSATCLSDLYLRDEDPIAKAAQIAAYMGIDCNDPKKLQGIFEDASVEDLLFATTMAEVRRPWYMIQAFLLPVVEKKFEGVQPFFEEFPLTSFTYNRFQKVPIILTVSSCEGALFFNKDKMVQDLRKLIPKNSGIREDSPKAYKIAEKLKQNYFKDKKIDMNSLDEYLKLISDAYFIRDILHTAGLISLYHESVYLFRFDYFGNMHTRVMKSLGINGATHGDIVQYQFYRESKLRNCIPDDLKVVDIITELWAAFVKTGIPSWRTNEIQWRPYSRGQYCLNIGDDIRCMPPPELKRLQVWNEAILGRCKI